MKKITTCLLGLSLCLSVNMDAQIADGSTVPDFTFTGLDGKSYNLYTYLNQGKYVALDVSATWCGPCWQYHTQIKTMDDLYTTHDTPGDNTWKVLWIDGDKKTTDADVKGTGSNTKGDWTKGTLFPLINPASGTDLTNFMSAYKITYYPTLFLICPNKKVYQSRLNDASFPWPVKADWETVALKCGVTGIDNLEDHNPLTIFPNPATGKEVGLYFNLNNPGSIELRVVNSLGQLVDINNYTNLPSGDQSLKYTTDKLSAGIYYFTVNTVEGRSISQKVIVE